MLITDDISIPPNRLEGIKKQPRVVTKGGEQPDTSTPVTPIPATPLPVATPDYAASLGMEYNPLVGVIVI